MKTKCRNRIYCLLFICIVFVNTAFSDPDSLNSRGKVFILNDPDIAKLGGDMAPVDTARLYNIIKTSGFAHLIEI